MEEARQHSAVSLAWRVFAALAVAGLICLVVRMELALSHHRQTMLNANTYWACRSLPPKGVLARVLAGRALLEQVGGGQSFWWHPQYAAYTVYYRWRVPVTELADNYRRTPSSREKNCWRASEGD